MKIRTQIILFTLVIGSYAIAQTAVEAFEKKNNLPQGFVTIMIGILASLLMGPLTAIAKRVFKTEGPRTVVVNIALSFVVVALCGWYADLYKTFWEAIYASFVAVIMSQGTYLMQANASQKGHWDYSQARQDDPGAAPTPVSPDPIPVTVSLEPETQTMSGENVPNYLISPSVEVEIEPITNPAYLSAYDDPQNIREVE